MKDFIYDQRHKEYTYTCYLLSHCSRSHYWDIALAPPRTIIPSAHILTSVRFIQLTLLYLYQGIKPDMYYSAIITLITSSLFVTNLARFSSDRKGGGREASGFSEALLIGLGGRQGWVMAAAGWWRRMYHLADRGLWWVARWSKPPRSGLLQGVRGRAWWGVDDSDSITWSYQSLWDHTGATVREVQSPHRMGLGRG